jgi:photosystem II stability/assembly factor-like uncharacterized protein
VDATHCFALSDPIDGKFLLLGTVDGEHWEELARDPMPPIIPGEGAFAASNSALTIYNKKEIYFGTGGGAAARVFHSPDLGRTWTAVEVPIAAGNASSGVFSIDRFGNTVIVVGGDYKEPNQGVHSAAYSPDGGVTWHSSLTPPGGYRSSVAGLFNGNQILAVGPNGIDVSRDDGVTWTKWEMSPSGFNAVAVNIFRYVWIVGAKGAFLYRGEMILRQ